MPNPDPHRPTGARDGTGGGVTRSDLLRALLWAVVVLSAVANMATSYDNAPAWITLACGLVTVLAAGTLVVRNLSGRR